jgi:hypothetical protein
MRENIGIKNDGTEKGSDIEAWIKFLKTIPTGYVVSESRDLLTIVRDGEHIDCILRKAQEEYPLEFYDAVIEGLKRNKKYFETQIRLYERAGNLSLDESLKTTTERNKKIYKIYLEEAEAVLEQMKAGKDVVYKGVLIRAPCK